MIDTPQIVDAPLQRTAAIRLNIARAEIQNAMGSGIQEVIATAHAQGVGPAGPWFTHHFRLDPTMFDFEICVPVIRPVTPTGRVVAAELPGGRVVRTIYRGDYAGLPEAWKEFNAWIAANGLQVGPDIVEVYLSGPESSADAATWQTELNRPLVG